MADGSLIFDTKLNTSGLSSGLSKLGSVAGSAMKGIAAGIGATSVAIAALGKESVKGFAEYEQLEGGIKKLYGNMGKTLQDYADANHKSVSEVRDEWQSLENAQNSMLQHADDAWKTAGMSANDYIQNVTGFSAALINSLSGDTEKAAEIADMAMRDISDNANTFGKYTANELAGVYQALAKGQYQTLDNLNLGFGGTKEGMQGLIDKANELSAEQGQAANLQIDSYADIVQAIHLVQESMNITGTTENEAATTIQGSISMTQAAWENLITGMGNSEADLDALITNLIESSGTVVENLIPVVETVLSSMATTIERVVPEIANKIPELITNVVPMLISSAAVVISSLANALLQNAPMILQSGIDLLLKLAEGLVDGLPQAIPTIVETVMNIVEILLDNSDKLVDAGIEIMIALVEGFINAEPQFLEKMPELLEKLARAIISGAVKLGEAMIELGKVMLSNFVKNLPEYAKAGGKILDVLFNALIAGVAGLIKIGVQLVKGIWEGISSATSWIKQKITSWVGDVVSFLKNLFGIHSPSKVMEKEVGKNIALGVIKGVDGEKKNVKKSAEELADLYVSAAKSRVSELKKANKLTEAQEISFWKEILSHCKKGTKAYNTASAQLTTAKNTLKKDISNLTSTYIKEIAQIQEKWDEDVNKILDDLGEKIEDLRDAYSKVVTDRAKEIFSSYNLFDGISSGESIINFNAVNLEKGIDKEALTKNLKEQIEMINDWEETMKSVEKRIGEGTLYDELKDMGISSLETLRNINSMSDEELREYVALYDEKKSIMQKQSNISKETLTKNLKDQVAVMSDWEETMKELGARIGEGDLYNELKDMGVSSLDTLKGLNTMSDNELKEYISLYNEKKAIAQREAERENESLRIQTDAQIAKLKENAAAELDALKDEADKQMEELKNAYEKGLKKLGVSMKKQSKDVSKAVTDGIELGLKTGSKKINKYLKSFAKSMIDQVKKELDIHSPSKKFGWIGKMCLDGFEQEFEDFDPYDSMARAMKANKGTLTMNYNAGLEAEYGNGFYDYEKNAKMTAQELSKAGFGVYIDNRAAGRLIGRYT